MAASTPIRELRRKAADLIITRIKTPPKPLKPISVAQAADDLKVTRQAVYDIMNRKYCPSLSMVHAACEAWGLTFDFRGILIEKAIFSPRKKETSPALSPQLSLNLVEAIQQIDYRSFEVIKAKPMGRVLEVTIRLTIPA